MTSDKKPYYPTAGGGKAELVDGQFVWLESPSWMDNAHPGHPIPSDWPIDGRPHDRETEDPIR